MSSIILRKFSKNSKSEKIWTLQSILAKFTIKGLWLLHWWGFKRWKSDTYTHAHTRTRTHTHTSGRHLKITYLDVLDYSEYSDTNNSKNFFLRKHSFLSGEAKNFGKKFWKNLGKKVFKKKFGKKNWRTKFGKKKLKTKILITNIYNNIYKCDIIFALLAPLDRNREKVLQWVMKKCAHTHSELIQNRQFWACIARKECGQLHEVGKKIYILYAFSWSDIAMKCQSPITACELSVTRLF